MSGEKKAGNNEKKSNSLLQIPFLLKEKWHIIKKLGGGGFGEIYEGRIAETGDPCAIKVESNATPKQVLKMEAAVLRRLQNINVEHVCEFLGAGRTETVNYVVMSLLGPNLSELRKKQSGGKLSWSTTFRLAVQMIKGVRAVHDCGFLHRDIKPSNFAMGAQPSTAHVCYILDFGLCRQYLTATGELREPRAIAGFRGTVRYASINAHQSNELGRHDDLQSLFYMLMEFLHGQLPWRRLKEKEEVAKAKEEFDDRDFLVGLPVQFELILAHLEGLDYYTVPDYQLLMDQFHKMIAGEGFGYDDPYDWEMDLNTSFPSTSGLSQLAQRRGASFDVLVGEDIAIGQNVGGAWDERIANGGGTRTHCSEAAENFSDRGADHQEGWNQNHNARNSPSSDEWRVSGSGVKPSLINPAQSGLDCIVEEKLEDQQIEAPQLHKKDNISEDANPRITTDSLPIPIVTHRRRSLPAIPVPASLEKVADTRTSLIKAVLSPRLPNLKTTLFNLGCAACSPQEEVVVADSPQEEGVVADSPQEEGIVADSPQEEGVVADSPQEEGVKADREITLEQLPEDKEKDLVDRYRKSSSSFQSNHLSPDAADEAVLVDNREKENISSNSSQHSEGGGDTRNSAEISKEVASLGLPSLQASLQSHPPVTPTLPEEMRHDEEDKHNMAFIAQPLQAGHPPSDEELSLNEIHDTPPAGLDHLSEAATAKGTVMEMNGVEPQRTTDQLEGDLKNPTSDGELPVRELPVAQPTRDENGSMINSVGQPKVLRQTGSDSNAAKTGSATDEACSHPMNRIGSQGSIGEGEGNTELVSLSSNNVSEKSNDSFWSDGNSFNHFNATLDPATVFLFKSPSKQQTFKESQENGESLLLISKQAQLDRLRGSGPEELRGSGPEDPRGSGPEDPRGSGPEDPRGSGPEDPMGSGPEEPRGSGPEDPRGSGPEDPRGSGPEDPRGSGPEDPRGSGPEEQRGSGPEEQRGSGPEEQRGSGPEEPLLVSEDKPSLSEDAADKPVHCTSPKQIPSGESSSASLQSQPEDKDGLLQLHPSPERVLGGDQEGKFVIESSSDAVDSVGDLSEADGIEEEHIDNEKDKMAAKYITPSPVRLAWQPSHDESYGVKDGEALPNSDLVCSSHKLDISAATQTDLASLHRHPPVEGGHSFGDTSEHNMESGSEGLESGDSERDPIELPDNSLDVLPLGRGALALNSNLLRENQPAGDKNPFQIHELGNYVSIQNQDLQLVHSMKVEGEQHEAAELDKDGFTPQGQPIGKEVTHFISKELPLKEKSEQTGESHLTENSHSASEEIEKDFDESSISTKHAANEATAGLMEIKDGTIQCQQSLVYLPRPSTDDRPRPSTDDRPRPFTDDRPRPFTDDRPRPSTDDRPHPSTDDRPHPSTDDRPRPSTDDRPRPFTDDRPRPSTDDRPHPSTDDRPHPSTDDRPRPFTDDRPRPSTDDRPHPSTDDRPRPFTDDRPRPSTDDRPRPFTDDRPHPSTDDRPRPSTDDRPRPSTDDRPHPSTDKHHFSRHTENAILDLLTYNDHHSKTLESKTPLITPTLINNPALMMQPSDDSIISKQHVEERVVSPDGQVRAVSPDGQVRAVSPDGQVRAVSPADLQKLLGMPLGDHSSQVLLPRPPPGLVSNRRDPRRRRYRPLIMS